MINMDKRGRRKEKCKNIILSMILGISSVCCQTANGYNVPDSCYGEIKGYTVGEGTYYSVDIYWRSDITFVYDKTGALPESASQDGDITKYQVERGASAGSADKWYGFDGIRNRIIVINRSNANVIAKYSASANAEVCGGETDIEIYGHSNNGNMKIQMDSNDDLNSSPESFGDEADMESRFGNEVEINPTTEHVIAGTPKDGYLYGNKVFINVTGKPTNENFSKSAESPSNIGTVTITLSKE